MNIPDTLVDEFEAIRKKGEQVIEVCMSEHVFTRLNRQYSEQLPNRMQKNFYITDSFDGVDIKIIEEDEHIIIKGKNGTVKKICNT